AQEALARLAWPEALNLCERALDAAPEGVEGDLWRAEALLAAGDARLRTGDDDEAAEAFGAAAELGRRHARWDVVARAALGFAAGLASVEVPLMEARQVALLEEAADVLDDGSPLRPLVLARLSVALSFMGADERRLQLADDAVRLARALGGPAALGAAIAARCDATAGPDHVDERLAAATEIVALAQQAGDVGLELLGRRHRVVALMERRDLHGVDAEVAAFARRAERLGDPLYTWYAPMWRAMRAHADGRLDEAEALSRQARAIGEAGGQRQRPAARPGAGDLHRRRAGRRRRRRRRLGRHRPLPPRPAPAAPPPRPDRLGRDRSRPARRRPAGAGGPRPRRPRRAAPGPGVAGHAGGAGDGGQRGRRRGPA